MSSVYANYSREDLIREIEILKAQGTSVNDEKNIPKSFSEQCSRIKENILGSFIIVNNSKPKGYY